MANDPYNNAPSDDEMDAPELPEVAASTSGELPAIAKARLCPTCKEEGRIVSNSKGISGHCFKCRSSWPISSTALRPPTPVALPRGLQKETRIEPDWNMAFDDIGGGNDPNRPK